MRSAPILTQQEHTWAILPQCINLVRYIAARQAGDYEDNVSEGILIYAESANTFDRNRNTSFKSYIGKCVYNGLINTYRKDRKTLHFQDMVSNDEEDDHNPEEEIQSLRDKDNT